MSLDQEIKNARSEISPDGYEMSIGEIINLYRDDEIVINPNFQRLFRWDDTRKTRFIESILLGIPVPPIFVYQGHNGIWELVDGLQRVSTILEFVGLLKGDDGNFKEPFILEGTNFLPSLGDRRWQNSSEFVVDGIGQSLQVEFKRARMRVEILKQESDPNVKYELFQRLNTGGDSLSPQEVRDCVAIMLDPSFHDWLVALASSGDFLTSIDQTDNALKKQIATELALRFLVFRNVSYTKGLDVHEFLDSALVELASDRDFDRDKEGDVFVRTFKLLNGALGAGAFKKWGNGSCSGKFLMSVFEVVATGVSLNIDKIESQPDAVGYVRSKCEALWEEPVFGSNSGAGIRGTTRLAKLLPLAPDFFKP